MTDEQIIKALERCGNIGLCKDCPYYHFNSNRGLGCHNNLMLDALDLIKRQQAEIDHFANVGKMIGTEEKMAKEYTITYNVEVTKIIKASEGMSEEFLVNDYPEVIKEKLKNMMELDDVKLKGVKIFPRD